jgi:hypothetical protein
MTFDPRRSNFRVPPAVAYAQPFPPLPQGAAGWAQTPGPKPEEQWLEDFAIYEVDFLNLAALTNAVQSVRIQSDSYFRWMQSTMTVDDDADAVVPLPLITMQVKDGGSNLELFSDPAPVASIFGNGTLPFVLPVPRIFNPNSLITLTVSNYHTTQQYNGRFSLIGCKLYKLGAQ